MCIPTLRSSTASHGHVRRLADFRNRAEMLMETLQAFDRRRTVPFTITLDTVGMSRPVEVVLRAVGTGFARLWNGTGLWSQKYIAHLMDSLYQA
jgi:hypothetical protein